MYTITKIVRREKVSKKGKPYESVSLQVKEHGSAWIGGFGNEINKNWKDGDLVDIKIVENGEYLNFEIPEGAKASPQKDSSDINDRLDEINEKLDELLNREYAGQ